MFTVSLILYVTYCYHYGISFQSLPLAIGIYFLTFQQRRRIRSYLVSGLANFVADVLEHPRVQAATASSIVAGMNATADQPDLPERVAEIYLSLQKQNEYVSRQLGEQFPKVAGAFLAGAVSGLGKPKDNNNNKNEEDKNKNEKEKKKELPEPREDKKKDDQLSLNTPKRPIDTPNRWRLFGIGPKNDEEGKAQSSDDNTEVSSPPSPPPLPAAKPGLFQSKSFDHRVLSRKGSKDEEDVLLSKSEDRNEQKKDV